MTRYLFILFVCVASVTKAQENKPRKELLQTFEKNFKDAAEQYKLLAKNLPPDKFPKTFFPATNNYEFSNSGWWCSGFYPGSLLYLYEETKQPALYAEAERILKVLEKEKYNTTTHDLGFMMFCSFGNANRIASKPEYKEILLTSAKSLATRFNPKVGCIKSWDGKPNEYLVIIDNMMNLELLFWATKVSGDSSFYKIAVTHANTTIKNHFRPDYSSYHVINYNAETGAIIQKRTAQGAADESAWARGQAWGLYGFTETYRETKDKKYLEQAKHIADFLLSHPNLPADKIPYWDFNAPGIPNALRDASAASIMASALLELSNYVDPKRSKDYWTTAETILTSLSNNTYKAAPGTNGGFIIQHCVGHMPNKTEIDVPLTYADYYFIEAMKRYKGSLNTTGFIDNIKPVNYASFKPGERWYDNKGEIINAHGGGLLYAANKYYWFGEKRGQHASEGVNVYSSKDLYNWKYEGLAFAQSDDTLSDVRKGCVIERPKVIYNKRTKKYVMWFHLELKGKGYSAARAGVAISDKVTGPYKFVSSFRPNGNMSRDMTLFVDDDGSAYHIYSSRENYDLRIAKLTDDYLSATKKDTMLFSKHREAPAVFKYQNQYYLITSGCTGWTPNKASLHVSNSLWGPWQLTETNPMAGPDADSTFGSQSTHIQPIQGQKDRFIFMADKWNPKNLKDSRYVWLPVQFKNSALTVEWMDEWGTGFWFKKS
jgi:hypothetical protein